MRHRPDTIVYATGWLEGQFESWKALAGDPNTLKVFTEAEAMFKTVSEGVDDLIKELNEAQRQLAVIRSLVGTPAERQIASIRDVLGA